MPIRSFIMKLNQCFKPPATRRIRNLFSVAGIVVGSGLVLGGCSPQMSMLTFGAIAASTNTPAVQMGKCLTGTDEILENVDWDMVIAQKIRIIDGHFRPMIMALDQNRPYIWVVENVDNTNRNIWAPDLFKQGVAVESVQFGDQAPTKGCINGIRAKARSSVVIRFVPVWQGRYEVYDSKTWVLVSSGPDAVVNIVPPRIGEEVK